MLFSAVATRTLYRGPIFGACAKVVILVECIIVLALIAAVLKPPLAFSTVADGEGGSESLVYRSWPGIGSAVGFSGVVAKRLAYCCCSMNESWLHALSRVFELSDLSLLVLELHFAPGLQFNALNLPLTVCVTVITLHSP